MFSWFSKQKFEDDGFDFIQDDVFVNTINSVQGKESVKQDCETVEEILERIEKKIDKLMEMNSDG